MERNGPPFGAGTDVLVYAGEVVSVGWRLRAADGTVQPYDGRSFALRVFGALGVTPINVAAEVVADAAGDYLSVTLTGDDTRGLVPAGRESASLRWSFDEILEDGRQVIEGGGFRVRVAAGPTLAEPAPGPGGASQTVIERTVADPVRTVTYLGAAGPSAYAFAVSAGYEGTAEEFAAALAAAAADLAAVLAAIDAAGQTELDAIASASAAVLEALGLAGDAELEALEALGDALAAALTQQANDALAALALEESNILNGIDAAGAGQANAVIAAGDAKLAQIAAASGVNLYATTAAGLAAVALGGYFATPGTNGAALNFYREDAGPVATLVAQTWGSDPANPKTLDLVQARYAHQLNAGERDYPDLLALRMYMGTLAGGAAKNADGTYNFPPGSTWTSPQMSAAPFSVAGNLFAYLPLTEALTGVMQIRVYWGGSTIAAGNTTTEPQAGVYRQTWNNSVPRLYVQIELKNVSASVTANSFALETYATDHPLLPQVLQSNLTDPAIDSRPRWEEKFETHRRWVNRRRPHRANFESNINKAINSVSGSDAATIGRFSPRQSIQPGLTGLGNLTAGDVIGLWGEWDNQGFGSILGSVTPGIIIKAQPEGRLSTAWTGARHKRLLRPRVNGDKDVTGQVWTLESGNCWKTPITMNTGTNLTPVNDGYSTLHVLRVENAIKDVTPLAAERLMKQATSKANCIATADSSWFESTGGANYNLYVNTPDGLAPDLGGYRYRPVTTFVFLAWGQNVDRPGGALYDTFVSHFNAGLGIVNGGQNVDYDGCVFAHNPKHVTNIAGGSINACFYYGRGSSVTNTLNIYHPDALGLSAFVRDVVIDSDMPGGPIYAHRGGTQFDATITDDILEVLTVPTGAQLIRDGHVIRNLAETVAVGTYVVQQLTSTESGGALGLRGTYLLTVGGQSIAATGGNNVYAAGNYFYIELAGSSDVVERAASGAINVQHPIAIDQTENALVEYNFRHGYFTAFGENGSWAVPCNSICRYNVSTLCSRNTSHKDKHDNVVICENASIDTNNRGMRMMRLLEGHKVHHETIIARNRQNAYGDANPAGDYLPVIYEIGSTAAQQQGQVPECQRSLFLIDCHLSTAGTRIRADASAGLAGLTDWNIIVNWTPGVMSSTAFGAGTKTTWEEYRATPSFSHCDANTKFVDWRGRPGGLASVLIDPDNYNLGIREDTEEGRYLLNLMWLMNVGAIFTIGRRPIRLTADDYATTLLDG